MWDSESVHDSPVIFRLRGLFLEPILGLDLRDLLIALGLRTNRFEKFPPVEKYSSWDETLSNSVLVSESLGGECVILLRLHIEVYWFCITLVILLKVS